MEHSLNEIEKAVLGEATGGVEPRFCLRTNTRVDTGRWWRRTPLWFCVTDDKLILLAVARRKYVQCIPLASCSSSYYCHATGELVIEPAEGVQFGHLAVSPSDALRTLDAMGLK